jgi:leucyl aminopeptidase
MKLTCKDSAAKLQETALVVVYTFEGDKPELPAGVETPKGSMSEWKGEFREARFADTVAGSAKQVLYVGLGKKAALDVERLRRAAAIAVLRAEGIGAATTTIVVPDAVSKERGAFETGLAFAEGAILGAYKFEKGKSKPKGSKLGAVVLVGAGKEFARGVERGTISARANAYARDLQNEPANRLTPKDLAAAAKAAVRSKRVTCKVLDEKAMEKLGMGLLLGVAAGSRQAPRFVHFTYKPKGKSKGRVCVVGKGLTFDSGGISIKPAAKMDEMRFDMSGAAAVIGLFHALNDVDVPFEVHGLCGCTENMPGDNATKPGDIHVAMDGTTVEVLNTDAEGRLVLADALCYAVEKVKPDVIVDLATLTGAVVTALGHEMSGFCSTSKKLSEELVAAGEATGERLWQLPLLDHHKDSMKGTFADLKNIAPGDMGAGSSAGAAFLAPFVKNVEWAHLDIAGTAWGGSARDWVGGPLGSGVGTRLLLRWLETRGG